MATRYYTENLSKVPFRLLYHAIKQSMPAPIAWLIAGGLWMYNRLGLRLKPTHGVAFFGSERSIDPSELPASAVAKWAPLLEQLRDLGFAPLRTQVSPTVGAKLQYSTLLLHEQSDTVAVLEWTRLPGVGGFQESNTAEFNSYAESGPDIVTGVVRTADLPLADMLRLDSAEVVSLANDRPLANSYQEHLARKADRPCVALSTENALWIADSRNARRFEELLEKQILRELSAEEIVQLEQADVGDLRCC